jgi:hypothetical protein
MVSDVKLGLGDDVDLSTIAVPPLHTEFVQIKPCHIDGTHTDTNTTIDPATGGKAAPCSKSVSRLAMLDQFVGW